MGQASNILEEIKGFGATLVAVSKKRSVEEIHELYTLGIRDFGENRVQELLSKKDSLPDDINWHLIGHLQSKKVKQIAEFIHLIHSVDRFELFDVIQKQGAKHERIIDVLLQVKVAVEATKFGILPEDIFDVVKKYNQNDYPNIRLVGMMGMASLTQNEKQISSEFRRLKEIFDQLKKEHIQHPQIFTILSMGMSSDYKIALKEGSNTVRIGSLLFT